MLSNDPTYPLFPILAFLSSVLALLPVPFTLQVWNTGACALAAWAATACLLSFINSVVWSGNVMNTVPAWCDISSKLLLGASIGIPASGLCISHRLWKVTSMRLVPETRREILFAIAIDLALSAGVPLFVMLLHIIVQSQRFTILEDIGCQAAIPNTLLSYFLVLSWPLGLGLASLIYAVLTLRLSYVHRLEFDHALAKQGTLRTALCLRLVLLALVAFTVSIVSSSLNIAALARSGPLIPWSEARRLWVPRSEASPSFTQTANSSASELASVPPWRSSVAPEWDPAFPSPDVSAVDSFNTSDSSSTITPDVALIVFSTWHAAPLSAAAIEAGRWAPVLCALAFFILFGLAGEASYHARVVHMFRKVCRRGTVDGFKLPHPKWEKAWPDSKHGAAEKMTYLGSLKQATLSNGKVNEKGPTTVTQKPNNSIGALPFYVAQVGQDASDDPFASTRKDPFAPADLSASRSRSLELCRTRSMYSEGLSRASSASSVYTARTSPGRRSDDAESVPALPVNVIPPSPEAPRRQQSLTGKSQQTIDKSLPEVPCDADSERSARLPSRSLMGGPSEETLPRFHLHPTQGLAAGQLSADRPRTPSARHAPQDSVTSLTSCDSLATSLGSARDVIYNSDAYATDPTHAYHANHGYWARASADSGYGAGGAHSQHIYYTAPLGAQPSPPPFSNLIPAPAVPEGNAEVGRAMGAGHARTSSKGHAHAGSKSRSPTPLPMLFGRRARSPSPVRVTVRMEREVEEV
ncbi:B pheromone receptor-like protein 1 [Schizophyllum commune H4-8]|nr:B pheromone receptor-like protein 1 [Schizophyllum commune H4-8]KAI5887454.1 B pheromone receptor-like protein 1 [Schizophyllum commune H4-8]